MNDIYSNNNSEPNFIGTLCTINICGLSQRSHMMLNKYVYDKNLTLLAVQETGSNHEFNQFDNMTTYQDMNR